MDLPGVGIVTADDEADGDIDLGRGLVQAVFGGALGGLVVERARLVLRVLLGELCHGRRGGIRGERQKQARRARVQT